MQLKSKRLETRRQSITSTTTQFHFSQQHQNHPVSPFPIGSEVEVSSDEEGFTGAWFLATVISPPSTVYLSSKQQQKVFVEYKNLLSDEDGSALLKEFVDGAFVRPKPHSDDEDKVAFEVTDVVDAFYQDGWWTGVVTEIFSYSVGNNSEYRYRVFFSNPPDEMEFGHSELRVHRDWVDGKWVLPEKQRMKELNFSPWTAVEVNTDSDNSFDVWFPATLIKQLGSNSFLVEFQSSKEAGLQKMIVDSPHIRPSPPRPSTTTFNLLEKVDGFYDYHWLSGVVTKILADGRYIVYFKRTKKEKELYHADMRLHMEWANGKWCFSSLGVGEEHSVAQKRGRPRKLQTLVSDAVNGTPNRSDVVSPLGSIVIELPHNGKMISSLLASSGQFMKENSKKDVENDGTHYDISTFHESVGNNGAEPQKDHEVTSLKRKRGRPPKVLFQLGSPKAIAADFVKGNDAVSDTKDNLERHFPTNEVDKSIAIVENPVAVVEPVGICNFDCHKKHAMIINDQFKCLSDFHKLNTSIARTCRKPQKISEDIVTEDIIEPVRQFKLRRGRQQRHYKQAEPAIEGAVDDFRGKVTDVLNREVAKDGERAVSGTISNMSDDDRLVSAWFEGSLSPTTVEGVLLARTVSRCDETGERPDTNIKQPTGLSEEKALKTHDEKTPSDYVIQDNNATESQDGTPTESKAIVHVSNEDLPFAKNSLIWQMIESMEVFKRMPQKPHFRPLYDCKEECREGLAIGNMVTFSSLVERISRLQFGDPKSLLNGYLEALVDLEELGFNVAPVREQLNMLLDIKGRHEQAQNTVIEIENQIMERKHEKSNITEETVELDKKLAELYEKRTLAVSRKEMKDAEIALLESSMETAKGSAENAVEEFEKVTARIW